MEKTNRTICIKCDKPAVDGRFCYNHHCEYKESQWLDNTDIDNLGIVKWAKDLLPEFTFNVTPHFHKELYYDLLSLYDPSYRNKYERLYELISFRESAKSTAANTIFSMYVVAHNGKSFKIKKDGEVKEFKIHEKLLVIISETSGSAEDFTVRIRDTFRENGRIGYYYRYSVTDAVDSLTGQWTRAAFKINGMYVQAVGSGQQIRGRVKGAGRPTLVIADDIYSENNTVTDERRQKIKRWWNNAVMNSIDNLMGKVLVLGTILHDDTIIVELENNPQWKHKKISVMPIDSFHKLLEGHIRINWDLAICYLPFDNIKEKDERLRKQKEYFDDLQSKSDWKLAWPERIDLFLLAIKWQEAVFNQSTSGFYQEYFHITTSPYDKRFRHEYFQVVRPYEFKNEQGYNWVKFDGEDKWRVCNVEFGVDLSGAGADDTVVTVIATLYDMHVLVLHQAIGKWGLRDVALDQTELKFNRVSLDRTRVGKIGIIDEAYRLAVRYHPSKIKVGVAGEEEQVVELMRNVFHENRNYVVSIFSRPQTVKEFKKELRILTTLLPYYEQKMVFHAPGLTKLEYQLEYLGKSKHDDCADSLECAMWNVDFPQNLDYTMFIVDEDLASLHKNESANFLKENWRWYGG